jgi:6-phosphogluconolactonase
MRLLFLSVAAASLLAACSENPVESPVESSPGSPSQLSLSSASEPGAIFIMTNAADGNAVLAFPRAADGSLGAPQSFPTGGLGSGGPLGNQGAVVLHSNGRLYVVNPGSDEITAFRVKGAVLDRIGTVPSGGDLPISIAIHGKLLYVLHDGDSPGVQGFMIGLGGALQPLAGSARPLSGSPVPDAAQVSFSSSGRRLVVTEKATNLLVTYLVMPDGLLSQPLTTPSAAPTPFGFAFGIGGTLLVSEAAGGAPDASVLSSYRPGAAGTWVGVSPATPTTESAACWVALTADGRFAYVTNTGSGTISGFRVRADGSLRLLDADGVTGVSGAGPIDLDLVGSRYLYTLNSADQSISAFAVGTDGDLTLIGTTAGLPATANGLQAR